MAETLPETGFKVLFEPFWRVKLAPGFALSALELAELDALFPPEAVTGGRYPEAGMVGIE